MSTSPAAAASPQGRLLLVDDEEVILRSLTRLLRREGWEVETALSADQALELLERWSPHVVVSDFRMPGMNGIDLLARVRERAPSVQRIMLTGQADAHAIEEAINRSQLFRFISKPWSDAELVLTIKSAFDQFSVEQENLRLQALTRKQNDELKVLNADLERRVEDRTSLFQRVKREWESTFDSIDQPLALVQVDGMKVRRANMAYSRLANKPIQQVGAFPPCYSYLFDRTEPCPGCPVRQGQGGQAELSTNGKTYALSVYLREEEGTAICTYRDVTEERDITRRLMESEKMVAVGNLAGGVAHEINNPLGGILAFAQLMKRDTGRSADDLESLNLIEEAALRCKRIVESLLKLSRRGSSDERRAVDLSQCVDDAVVLFRAQLKAHPRAKLELNLTSGLPAVRADPGQLGQVVLNLLQNGLQALPSKEGTLTVATGPTEGGCFFRVTDTGSGIASEHLGHIFEPHFTTKPPGEGTGLGLAIAYRIVQDHGGAFQVRTEVGKGSEFTVRLPALLGS